MNHDQTASISQKYFSQEISRKKIISREIREKFEREKIEIQIRFFLYFWYFDC
jgi:hypothetical protein